jgi:hypothetical protein
MDTVGKLTWAQAGDEAVFNRILMCILDVKEGAIDLLHRWWLSA